jgi:pimeloyl-ACP methyl ester carboxylesterase
MTRWLPLLLLLFPPLLAAAVPPSLQQVCLDDTEGVCAWQANPGAEQAVVLVHGLNGSAIHDWKAQLALLAETYHVLAIELPGFDGESGDPARYSVGYFSEVIRRFSERYIGHRYYLVGHSMGGAIALRHALYYPDEIQRLVLVDVAGVLQRVSFSREIVGHWARGGTGEHAGLAGFLEKMTMKFVATGEEQHGSDESANEAMLGYSRDPRTLASLQLVRQDFSGQLVGMTVPTLLIWGEEDPIAPLRTGYALNARLPNARLHILAAAKHMPMRERPDAFNRKLLDFLRADGAMPGDEVQYRIPAAGNDSTRVANCHDSDGGVYEGDYARLELRGCERVVIRNARIKTLKAYHSRISVLNSYIGGSGVDTAMETVGADVKVTASHLRGATALGVSGSRIDIAGSTLCASTSAVRAVRGSDLVFSISELRTPGGRRYLHGFYELESGRSLPSSRQ